MKTLVLTACLAALVGCDTGVNDCASVCTLLWGCTAECSGTEDYGVILLLQTICANTDNQALANASCVDACLDLSSTEQAQTLQCLTAAATCADALACP